MSLLLLLFISGAFAFWYFYTVTLTGRVVDKEGNVLPYVSYGKVHRVLGTYDWFYIGKVSDKGLFKIENISYGELCIMFSYDVVKGDHTYQLSLLEKCADVDPFEDRDVGDIVIDIDEALRLTPFKELKDSKELIVFSEFQEKKRVIVKE